MVTACLGRVSPWRSGSRLPTGWANPTRSIPVGIVDARSPTTRSCNFADCVRRPSSQGRPTGSKCEDAAALGEVRTCRRGATGLIAFGRTVVTARHSSRYVRLDANAVLHMTRFSLGSANALSHVHRAIKYAIESWNALNLTAASPDLSPGAMLLSRRAASYGASGPSRTDEPTRLNFISTNVDSCAGRPQPSNIRCDCGRPLGPRRTAGRPREACGRSEADRARRPLVYMHALHGPGCWSREIPGTTRPDDSRTPQQFDRQL